MTRAGAVGGAGAGESSRGRAGTNNPKQGYAYRCSGSISFSCSDCSTALFAEKVECRTDDLPQQHSTTTRFRLGPKASARTCLLPSLPPGAQPHFRLSAPLSREQSNRCPDPKTKHDNKKDERRTLQKKWPRKDAKGHLHFLALGLKFPDVMERRDRSLHFLQSRSAQSINPDRRPQHTRWTRRHPGGHAHLFFLLDFAVLPNIGLRLSPLEHSFFLQRVPRSEKAEGSASGECKSCRRNWFGAKVNTPVRPSGS
jgi:hypothetical protein